MAAKKKLFPAALCLLLAVTPFALAQDGKLTVEVRPGDTLFGLVRIHYPNSPSRWSLIENEIFVSNPHAFSNDDKSRLRVGAILDLPVYDVPEAGLQPLDTFEPEPQPVRHSLATVGTIAELSGAPLAIDINNEQRLLTLGGKVYRGDAILTEGDSAAQLQMNDGAKFYLRAESRLVIDEYSFIENAPETSRSIVTLLKGGFRAITGLIGRHNPASIRINTTAATIGVRGTDFAVRICGLHECSLTTYGVFEPGDYSGVLGGEITITNAAGTTPVAFGEIVRTATPDTLPVPAPEAAGLIFTDSELALLESKKQKPMNFFQWLRSRFSRKSADGSPD